VWIEDFVALAVGGLICISVFIAVCWLMPESPEFLLRQGRREAALRSLRQLRGSHYDVQEEMKQLEFNQDSSCVSQFQKTNYNHRKKIMKFLTR
jgi:hypothetical protein